MVVTYDELTARLDNNKVSKFYIAAAIIATMGGLTWGYDSGIIGSTLVFVEPFFKLSALDVALLVSGTSILSGVGALAAGPITDRWGRRILLIIDAVMYGTFAILSALATTSFLLLIWRSLIGFSIGADSAIATGYVAEFAPAKSRGRLAISQQLMIFIGFTSSFWAGYFLSSSGDWRLMYALGAVPAIIMLAARFYLPESPRWLLVSGKVDIAKKVFKRLGLAVDGDIQAPKREATYKELLHSRVMRRSLIAIGLYMLFFNTVGGNIILYYGPSIYVYLGLSGSRAILNTAISESLGAIAYVLSFMLIDRMGRRKLALIGYAGIAGSLFFMVISLHAFLSGVLGLTVLGVFISATAFLFFAHTGLYGVGWVVQGEVFPTQFRGRAGGLIAADTWFSNWFIVFLFPIWSSLYGDYTFFILTLLIAVAAVIVTYYLLPETKGRSVDQMSFMFSRSFKTYRKPLENEEPGSIHGSK